MKQIDISISINMPEISTEAHKAMVATVINFLDATHCHETARTLEKETGFFFRLVFFEDCFLRGFFDAAEVYLSGFTKIQDNIQASNVFFELRWNKLLQALHEHEYEEAHEIIDRDLKPFAPYNPSVIDFATEIADLDDFRDHPVYERYGDPAEKRRGRIDFIRVNLAENPMLFGKILYPSKPGPGGRPPQVPPNLRLPPPGPVL